MVKAKLAVTLCFHQFLEFFDFFFHISILNWLILAPSEEGFLGYNSEVGRKRAFYQFNDVFVFSDTFVNKHCDINTI